jgi:hypothetical protein
MERDDSIGGGVEQLVVQLEGRQVAAPPLRRVLVAHAHPDVGVDRVRAGRRHMRVIGQLGQPLLDPVAVRTGDDDLDPGDPPEDRQRAGHVVAVPDVREAQPVDLAEALLQRQ